MAIDLSQFHEVFFEETAEHLQALEGLLLGLDLNDPEAEQLNAIFRAAHSIKGSSSTFGFFDLADVTHVMESLLDRVRKRQLAPTQAMIDTLLAAGDVLKHLLAVARGQAELNAADKAAILERLETLDLAVQKNTSPPVAAPTVASLALQNGVQAVAALPAENYRLSLQEPLSGDGDAGLLAELRALGELNAGESPNEWVLSSAAKRDQLENDLAFLLHPRQWALQAIPAPAPAPVPATAPAPGTDDGVDDAYGFFMPIECILASPQVRRELPAARERGGQTATSFEALEGSGYGFFQPIALAECAAAMPAMPANLLAPAPAPVRQLAVAVDAASPATAEGARRAPAKPAAASPGTEAASIRVSVERADQLINLVGELVITQAMLLQSIQELGETAHSERLQEGLTQLQRNTHDMQEAVMAIRMLPIANVFSRFPRVVHDLASQLDKRIRLQLSGEDTEIDKGLIERIADPLTHLVRNSVDHGIESPEARRAAGKPEEGTIFLNARHSSGSILIEVSDDGAGISRQRVLEKARERGLAVSDAMSDQEVFQLIFEPGFSTATSVTGLSGRGVGMDVVKRNVQGMGGRVDITSVANIGTRITIRLPLTLAILDGMSVVVGEETYILPLAYVMETQSVTGAELRTLTNRGRVLELHGEFLPVVILRELLGLPAHAEHWKGSMLVVLDVDGQRAAILVDALRAQHQVVIKSLEQHYRKVTWVSGATILGDGRVALILDATALVGASRTTPLAAER